MTTSAARVISVRFDERPQEWRNYVGLDKVDEIVDSVLAEPPSDAPSYVRGHREIHSGARPFDPRELAMGPMMLIAVGGGYGAVYFRELDPQGGPVGFVARGDGVDHPPVLSFNEQGSIDFEAADVLTRERLRQVVRAYLIEGVRPAIIEWRESDWVR
jgi:hypothetical protein